MALTDDRMPSVGDRLETARQKKPAVNPGLIRWAAAALVIAAALGAWEAAISLKDIPGWKAPAPSGIGRELWESRGLLAGHTWVTFKEVLAGFGIAFGAGVITASLIAWSRTLRLVLYPPVVASATIPWIVVAPLLLIWVGYGMQHKVIVVALISFFPIVVNTVDGLGSANPGHGELAAVHGRQPLADIQESAGAGQLALGLHRRPNRSDGGGDRGCCRRVGRGPARALATWPSGPSPSSSATEVYASIFLLSAMGIGLFLLARVVERLALPWRYDRNR